MWRHAGETQTGDDVDFKKLTIVICVAFVIFFIVTSPDNAANVTHGLWSVTVDVAHSIGRFLSQLGGNG